MIEHPELPEQAKKHNTSFLLKDPQPDMNEAFAWWERWRIVFNAIMLVWGALLLVISGVMDADPVFAVIGGILFAVGINLTYMIGILLEYYDKWLLKSKLGLYNIRHILWILGTLASLAFAGLCVYEAYLMVVFRPTDEFIYFQF